MITLIYDKTGDINAVMDLTEEQIADLGKSQFIVIGVNRVVGNGFQQIRIATPKQWENRNIG